MQKAAQDSQGFLGKVQTLGKVAAGAVGVGVTAAVGAVGLVIGKTLPMAADFQDRLVGLQIAASQSGLSFDQLHDSALAVGGDTRLLGVSATGAADSMTGLYKAGLTTTEIFGDLQGYMAGTAQLGGALRASIDLAAATELNMVSASDLAAVALATFGGELETEAERADFVNGALNNLVQAADASVAEVSGLADALKNVGPVASSMGMSIEETNNALAILSTRGIQGSEAGTALKSMLANMRRTTPAVTTAMEELGVSLYDAHGEFVGLPSVIEQMQGAMAGLTQEQRDQYVQTIAGSYGMNALNTLLAEGTAGWDAMAEATANAAGIQEQAAAKAQTFSGRMEALKGTLEAAGIKIGEAFLPAATTLINTFSNIVDQVGPRVTEFFEGLGPVLERVATAISLFVSGLAAGADPVSALQGALAGIGLTELANTIGDVRTKVLELWAVVQPYVEQAAAWIGQNVELQDVLIALGIAIAAVVLPALWGIVTAAAPIIAVAVLLVAVVAALRQAWETNFLGIRDFFAAVVVNLQTVGQAFAALFRGDWEAFMAALKTIWQNNWDLMVSVLSSIGGKILDAVRSIIDRIKTAFTSFDWGALGKAIIDGIANGIKAGASAIAEAAKAAARAALDAAKRILGISSPSRAFALVGRQMMYGMAGGISATARVPAMASMDAATRTVRSSETVYNFEMNVTPGEFRERDVVGGFEVMRALVGA